MQSQATTSAEFRARASGWIQFAGVMTIITGFLNVIDGAVGLYRASVFRDIFVFGNLRFWAFAWIAFGIVQGLAGFAILGGRSWGRWFGIATVTINAFVQLLAIGSYPLWSFVILAYDIAIFYALTVHWERRLSRA